MAIISIEGMEFYANHGCFAEERRMGTRFLVDLKLTADTTYAEQHDSLEGTVDYSEVYLIVKREMEIPSKLIEHVARRIVDAVIRNFPAVQGANVKVSKLNPPLGGKIEATSVEIESFRDNK